MNEAVPASVWANPDRVLDLKRLWAEGLSASQIAGVLGVSRNTICGKIHRLGISGTAPQDKRALTAGRATRQAGWKPRQWTPPMSREERARRQAERNLLREITRQQPLPPAQQSADFLHLTFDQLTRKVCHYPIGEEPPFTFCGQPTFKGSWCRHCFRITHN